MQAVRNVAEASGANEPHRISTRIWDNARPLSERFADAPAARRICEHLNLPWSKVVELAFMSPRGQLTGLGHALNEKEGNWLTAEYSDFVLALVAHRLGVRTLTPWQYRSERDAMLAAQRRRAKQGGQLQLPTDEQIAAVAGSWDQALAHAGLGARHGLGGYNNRSRAVAIVDVLDRCFEHHRTEPTISELETFARANGISFPKKERGRS